MALTAAHSSTLVEECIRVLRKLHSIHDWTNKINDYVCLKLSLVSEIVAEIPILQMQLDGSCTRGDNDFAPCGRGDDDDKDGAPSPLEQ